MGGEGGRGLIEEGGWGWGSVAGRGGGEKRGEKGRDDSD